MAIGGFSIWLEKDLDRGVFGEGGFSGMNNLGANQKKNDREN
jgi:hypothetical protein